MNNKGCASDEEIVPLPTVDNEIEQYLGDDGLEFNERETPSLGHHNSLRV